MWKEAFVLIALYLLVIATHEIGQAWKARAELRRRLKADADALAPLSALGPVEPKPLCFWGRCRRHAIAAAAAVIMHPATAETVKHYAVHFVVYSGYVIKGH